MGRASSRDPEALRELAEAHCQQDPTFSSSIAFTRLTAAAAMKHLKQQGFLSEQLPSSSVIAQVLNRSGYRLRTILKAKTPKNSQKQMPSLPTSNSKTRKSMTVQLND